MLAQAFSFLEVKEALPAVVTVVAGHQYVGVPRGVYSGRFSNRAMNRSGLRLNQAQASLAVYGVIPGLNSRIVQFLGKLWRAVRHPDSRRSASQRRSSH
jgi:hypothetical protein